MSNLRESAQLAAKSDDKAQPVAWTPTRDNLNALPEPIRKHIADLETICDPAGIVAENTILKDCNRWLQIMYRRAFSEGVEAAAKTSDAHMGRPVAGEVLAHAIRHISAPQPPVEQSAELSDEQMAALQKAWYGVGADFAGLKWGDFVAVLAADRAARGGVA